MKTSIFIPVNDGNISNIKNIILSYNNGTIIPDEIVINAIGVEDEITLSYLREVQKLKYDNVKIYSCKTHMYDSENMNYANTLTTGDIIMYHNPLSVPSTKRVEIIKNHFDTEDSLVVHHQFFGTDELNSITVDKYTVIESKTLYDRYYPFKDKYGPWQFTKTYGQEVGAVYIDYESVCVKREVLDRVKWKTPYQLELYKGDKFKGMCYEFCLETLYIYNRSEVIMLPLTVIK